MRRNWALAGIGLLAMATPAQADMHRGNPAQARAATLSRLQSRLDAERATALATGAWLASASPMMHHHPRAARAE